MITLLLLAWTMLRRLTKRLARRATAIRTWAPCSVLVH